MSNLRNALSTYWEVIVSPNKAFDRIKEEKPFFIGSLVLVPQLILVSLFLLFISEATEEYTFSGVGVFMALFGTLARIFVTVFFIDYVAKGIYKIKSNYSSLLACWFFTLIPSVFLLSFWAIVIATDLGLTGMVNLENYIFLIIISALSTLVWVISLDIKAVRAVYGLPTVKTVISYIIGTILAQIVMSLIS